MKNTNSRGFIATSLIYSFLILFAGLVALILNNYTYYRTSLDNYNKNIISALNSKIDNKYITLNSLLINSDFESDTNNWNSIRNGAYGSLSTSIVSTSTNGSKSLEFRGSSSGRGGNDYIYLKQNFTCQNGHYYYFSYDLIMNGNDTSRNSFQIGIDINTYNNKNITWVAGGFINAEKRGFIAYSNRSSNECEFGIKYFNAHYDNTNSDSLVARFDNILLTDVTSIVNRIGSSDDRKTAISNGFLNIESSTYLPYFEGAYSYNVDLLQKNV